MEEIQTIEDIQNLVREGCTNWDKYGEVYARPHDGLVIFNYRNEAAFAGRWNFFETVSRGLILEEGTGRVVARPFDKFFNWGQMPYEGIPKVKSVYEKMDGSLGISYIHNGKYNIATRGSMTSDQAIWATEHLNKNHNPQKFMKDYSAWTFLFEIVYPDNRIVIDYEGESFLCLLNARHQNTGGHMETYVLDQIAEEHGFRRPKSFNYTSFYDIISDAKTLDGNKEGWVIKLECGSFWKVKGERYCELHRLVSKLSFKNTLSAVRNGTYEEIKAQIPDEFLDDFNIWSDEIISTHDRIYNEVRVKFQNSSPLWTRKEFATWVFATAPHYAKYLFALLDDRPISDLIYKNEFDDRLIEERGLN